MEKTTKKKNSNIPFSINLKKLMQEKGISQRSLAKLAGIKLSTLNDWLAGANPSDLKAVAEICKVLKVDFEYLLLGSRASIPLREKSLTELFDIETDPQFSGLFLIEAKRLRKKN